MKCPKCGFNSFEYYDNCKKCSNDLLGFKQTYAIASMVLPFEAKEKLSADISRDDNSADQIDKVSETHDDMFSFNLPDEPTVTPAQTSADPFDFNEPSVDTVQVGNITSDDNVFSDLLESSPQTENSTFAEAQPVSATAAVLKEDSSASPGEFDLESFSWDDVSAEAPASTVAETAEAADDFDSLFGDTKETISK